MTLDSSSSPLINNYAPVNYRQQTSGDVFGGHYPIQTASGIALFYFYQLSLLSI